jgi:hypothetical protein
VLLAGGSIGEARKQFGLVYGFVALLRDPDLPKVLDDYEYWLRGQGWSHTPERFRHWVKNEYIPYFYRARLEPVELPTSIVKGSRAIVRFRATNTSPEPWRFSSKHDRGIHLGGKARSVEPRVGQEIELRGGFRDVTVAPGEAIVLELEIPPILESGRYQFVVDLVNEHVKWFSEMGSEPLTFEIRIEESNSPKSS